MEQVRLTQLTHGGGCGCKLAPAVLAQILTQSPGNANFSDLLVGTETDDDAAVYRLNDEQAVVATTDFFTPIVDNPFDFGRIAATNALSDVYAMGGTPIFALALVGFPITKLPLHVAERILAGGASVCGDAGIPIAGGHSIDTAEPIYGLAVTGLVHPNCVRRNSTAHQGDKLILTKALGVGVYSGALKKGLLDDLAYQEMLRSATMLNSVGAELGHTHGVHAMTDVTGFGLLGHLLEICRGSSLRASVDYQSLPFLSRAQEFSAGGIGTGAATRNWASYGNQVHLDSRLTDDRRNLLCDPQTSGGLLIACAQDSASNVLELVRSRGFQSAELIGELLAGTPGVDVR